MPIQYFKMSKCTICGNKIAELFLGKLKGTIVKKPGKNKQYMVCFECQKKFPDKEELLKKISWYFYQKRNTFWLHPDIDRIF